MVEHILFMIIHQEIENANGVHGCEFVIPIPPFGLFLNGEGGIEQAAIFEVDLFNPL